MFTPHSSNIESSPKTTLAIKKEKRQIEGEFTEFWTWLLKTIKLKGSRICHSKMPLWHKDYLSLLFLRNSRHRRSSENPSRRYPLVRDIYNYKWNLCLQESLPLCTRERRMRRMTKSLQTLTGEEVRNLNLHNNHALAYCALHENLP